MMKFSVGIFNMNEILDGYFEDEYINKSTFTDISCKYNRYNGNKIVTLLSEER